jgi:hypothetical protein
MPVNTIEEAIAFIVATYGIEELNNTGRCMALLGDLIPKQKDSITLIKHVFDNRLTSYIVTAQNKTDQEIAINKLYSDLCNRIRLSESAACEICNIFIVGLDWDVEAPEHDRYSFSDEDTNQSAESNIPYSQTVSNSQNLQYKNKHYFNTKTNKAVQTSDSSSITHVLGNQGNRWFTYGTTLGIVAILGLMIWLLPWKVWQWIISIIFLLITICADLIFIADDEADEYNGSVIIMAVLSVINLLLYHFFSDHMFIRLNPKFCVTAK